MGIDIFIGSTKQDLEACRTTIRKAIVACGENPVAMESWLPANFDEDPIIVCHRRVHLSSHYLGIIGFRYGWAPKKLDGKSITWSEFEWAEGKPRFVFVPNRASHLGEKLLANSSAMQDKEEEQQQQANFLKVIESGYYKEFHSLNNLRTETIRLVTKWSVEQENGFEMGALRTIANAASQTVRNPPTPPVKPSEEEICQLGRDKQFGDFTAILVEFADPSVANRGCFLIHGPPSFGQRMLSTRLRKYVENDDKAPEVHCLISIKPLWQQQDLVKLIQLIGKELTLDDPIPETPEALAPRLEALLKVNDVILEITDMQRFKGGIPEFAERFWRPLNNALPRRTPHRLVVLLTLEQILVSTWEPWLQASSDELKTAFDPQLIVKLPVLDVFTTKELTIWMRRQIVFEEPDDAWNLSEVLINEAEGGKPQLLCTKLGDLESYL